MNKHIWYLDLKENIIREESRSNRNSSSEVLTTYILRYLSLENGKSWDTSHHSPWHILPQNEGNKKSVTSIICGDITWTQMNQHTEIMSTFFFLFGSNIRAFNY